MYYNFTNLQIRLADSMSISNSLTNLIRIKEIVRQNRVLLEQNENLLRENTNLKGYISGSGECKITDYKRWINLANHSSTWNPRTEMIAKMIQPDSSIIEFGAGRKILKNYIDRSCRYQPSDCVDRGDDTMILDLNTTDLPNLPHYDYAVFSGVIEYLTDVSRVVKWLNTFADHTVLSYLVVEGEKDPALIQNRRNFGWVNDYTDEEIMNIFMLQNFELRDKTFWIDNVQERNESYKHIIYLFEKKSRH